jgi:hypothetical protein
MSCSSCPRIFDDSLHDHWYTAGQAGDYGFIDGIVDSFGQVMPDRRHRIGLKGRHPELVAMRLDGCDHVRSLPFALPCPVLE